MNESITGQHHVETQCQIFEWDIEQFREHVYQDTFYKMGLRLFSKLDDRQYVITRRWIITKPTAQSRDPTTMKARFTLTVVLFRAEEAEIGEYASLGLAEVWLKDQEEFILLGKNFMFKKDHVGWRRVEYAPEVKLQVDLRVKELQGQQPTATGEERED